VAGPTSPNDIYRRPDDYDLEHEHDERDVFFYRELMRRLAPSRVLDLACGSGRVTIPLAELGASCDFDVVGVDISDEMLERARDKAATLGPEVHRRLSLCPGDMRNWSSDTTFDVVLITCSSITHLLTLDDQLTVWRRAFALLNAGGRFVIDVTMPNLRAFVESLQTPPRALLEVDIDSRDTATDRRLVRYKATSFDAFQQRALIRFFYDRFEGDAHDRYLSDFESHVYFPRELQLLFLQAGFSVESTWADYAFRAPRSWSRELVMVGLKPRQRETGESSQGDQGDQGG
jgi:SAM-dependent methyltransferase